MNAKEKTLSTNIISFSLVFSVIGFACLSYEVILNRLFAFIAYRPLVFVEISFAILGIGLGAILFPRVAGNKNKGFPVNILALYGISMPLTFFMIVMIPPKDSIIVMICSRIVSMLPFIFMGILASYFYSEKPEKSGILYAFDLCGASLGAIFAVFGIDFFGPIKYTILLSLFIVVISIAIGYFQKRKIGPTIICFSLMTFGLVFLLLSPSFQDIPESLIFNRNVKGKSMFDLSHNDIHKEKTRWNSVGRLDLVSYKNVSEYKHIFIDGATPAIMYNHMFKHSFKYDGKTMYANPLMKSVCFAPFSYGSNDKVLSIGCGGGLDCLLARIGNAKEITAVEVNRELLNIVNEQKDFNGDVLNMPKVNAVVDEGRSFIRSSKEKYDTILFLLTQGNNAEAQGKVMLEDYLMTIEAFDEYYAHLNSGGKIAVATHDFVLMSRHLMTWIEMLRKKGIAPPDAVRRVALLNSPEQAYSFLLLFHKEIPPKEDLLKIIKFTDTRSSKPIYVPYLLEDASPIGGIATGALSVEDYMKTMPHLDISPVTDNKPFHNYVYKGIFGPLKQLLVITCIVLIVMILIPLKYQAPRGLKKEFLVWELFFTCLGIGFMLAEVVLIRRLMLYLGYPALSLAVVLSSMLLSSGLGGAITNKFYSKKKYSILFIAPILLALLFSFYLFFTTGLMDIFIDKHIVVRCILTFFIIALPGVFLGMPFPAGLSISSNQIPNASNWMWGINGIASVLGSILAIILSTLYGMNIAIWAAAAIYSMAGVMGYTLIKSHK